MSAKKLQNLELLDFPKLGIPLALWYELHAISSMHHLDNQKNKSRVQN
jgi:hypothetical protein